MKPLLFYGRRGTEATELARNVMLAPCARKQSDSAIFLYETGSFILTSCSFGNPIHDAAEFLFWIQLEPAWAVRSRLADIRYKTWPLIPGGHS